MSENTQQLTIRGKPMSYEKVKRRLSYKLPVTLRYGFAIGFFVGFFIAMGTRKPSHLIKTMIMGTFLFGFGTCYEEFSFILKHNYLEYTRK